MATKNALTKYEGPCEVTFDSRTLAEATSCSISVAPNSTPVNTMKKGLAGRSRGPAACTLRVANAIPKAGLEVDFIDKCVDDADVTLVVIIGGKRRAFDGWISSVETEFSTGAAAGATFTVMAGKPRKL